MNDNQLIAFDNNRRHHLKIKLLGGLDEAGRGCLAGPVVAACVVFDSGAPLPGLNDSKKITATRRKSLVEPILEHAKSWGLGFATNFEIDRINILQATLLASRRAMRDLKPAPEFLLTDYLKPRGCSYPLESLIKGDNRSQVIAAASVLAKVASDHIMIALDKIYPDYGFSRHKGYGTKEHRETLHLHGPSKLHRVSFAGVGFFDLPVEKGLLNSNPLTHKPVNRLNKHHWMRILSNSGLDLDPTELIPLISTR